MVLFMFVVLRPADLTQATQTAVQNKNKINLHPHGYKMKVHRLTKIKQCLITQYINYLKRKTSFCHLRSTANDSMD